MTDYIPMRINNIKNTRIMLENLEEKASERTVAIFPEGTRSRTEEMLPFKKGAFWFAFDLNLPILPVTINGTRQILPPGTMNLLPGKAEIIIHPPIDTQSFGKEKMPELIAETRSRILGSLK